MKNRVLIWILAIALVIGSIIFVLYQTNRSSGSGRLGDVVINEVMASNSQTIPDENGRFFDWIELYNQSDQDIDLAQWGLSDRADGPRWAFPDKTILPAHGYIVVYCAGKDASQFTSSDGLYASFKMKANSDVAALFSPSSQLVEQVTLSSVPNGSSLGRSQEDASQWIEQKQPTPGFENSQLGYTAYEATLVAEPVGVVINEIQAKNITSIMDHTGDRPDWIELYNTSAAAVDLSGFGLSNSKIKPMRWKFPEGTIIQPGAYLVVFASGDETRTTEQELHTNFKLSSFQGEVCLSNPKAQRVDEVIYQEIPVDQTFARILDGTWSIQGTGTPGLSNDPESEQAVIESASYGKGDLVISEVMLYSQTYEEETTETYSDWIEIHNRSANAIDLSDYGLSNNAANPSKWRFPKGTMIEPGEYKLMMASGTLERDADSKKKFLDLNYRLSNGSGELITLWSSSNQLLDRMAVGQQHRQVSYGRGANDVHGYFLEPTPGAVNSRAYIGYTTAPTIDLAAGFYQGAQNIAISLGGSDSSAIIRYTLDGSEPVENSTIYQTPILIDQTSVVRARAFPEQEQLLPSEISTSTYLINQPHNSNLSIVSLAANPSDFFDATEGIYVKGNNAGTDFPFYGANFWRRNWEKPAHIEIFDPQGNQQLDQDVAVRIFGSYSRGMEQKGLAILARSTYGPDRLNAPIFENLPYDSYKSIVLRSASQDATITKLHDLVALSLAAETGNLKTQAYRQSVLYLNGEYFGIYNIQEKISRNWMMQHYGIKDADNIDVMVGMGSVLHGDDIAYKELTDFCEKNDISTQENYEHVKTLMDVDNYIDYLIAEMYVMNTDSGNIKWFRERSDDPERSKFRWIYYDFCWSFINTTTDPVKYWTDPVGHGVGKVYSTLLPRSLFKNEEFRAQFLNRSAELLNSVYAPEHVIQRIEECEAKIQDEVLRDVTRWPYPKDENRTEFYSPEESFQVWQSNVQYMKDFAQQRKGYMISYIAQYYNLSSADTVRIFGEAGAPLSE